MDIISAETTDALNMKITQTAEVQKGLHQFPPNTPAIWTQSIKTEQDDPILYWDESRECWYDEVISLDFSFVFIEPKWC